MTWIKGISGNPRGRPPLDQSLAECIRATFTPELRHQAVKEITDLAARPDTDPYLRLKALELLAKFGWPDESRRSLSAVSINADVGPVVVQPSTYPSGYRARCQPCPIHRRSMSDRRTSRQPSWRGGAHPRRRFAKAD
jgi:hypothetical protein